MMAKTEILKKLNIFLDGYEPSREVKGGRTYILEHILVNIGKTQLENEGMVISNDLTGEGNIALVITDTRKGTVPVVVCLDPGEALSIASRLLIACEEPIRNGFITANDVD